MLVIGERGGKNLMRKEGKWVNKRKGEKWKKKKKIVKKKGYVIVRKNVLNLEVNGEKCEIIREDLKS
jgi:hypothetical protein